jgi:ankyrin repeat protein
MKITQNKRKISEQNSNMNKNLIQNNFIINFDYSIQNLYEILIKNPFLVNQKDKKGETLLSYAIERDKNEIFDLILTSPVLDLNYQNKEGNSYLHLAVQFEREEMVSKLIKKGIFLNFQNNDGNTALHFAHLIGNTNIIKILIENNIDFTLKNNLGEIAEQCYTGNNKSNSNVDYDILSDSDINDDLIKQNDNNNLETKTNKLIKFSDDNIINKNREFNLSLSDRFNNYNKIKSQKIYFKKKEDIINNKEIILMII